MIPLKDKNGNTLCQIDERAFPVFFDATTRWGGVEYPIYVKFEKEGEVKTMNMSKRPKK